jgi:hypothetical protein
MRRGILGLAGVLAATATVGVSAEFAVSGIGKSPACGQRRERGLQITLYCGPASASITVAGKTYRARGGACFNDFDHSGNPNNWYAIVGKWTDTAGFDRRLPLYAYLHVVTRLRKPGTYKTGTNFLVALQIPGIGEPELQNRVWRTPWGAFRTTGSATITSPKGVGPIPQRGTFEGKVLVLSGGTAPPTFVRVTGSWRC